MLLGLPEHVFLNNKVLPLLPPMPQYTAEGPDKGREVVGERKLLEGGGEIGEETQCQQQPAEEEVKLTICKKGLLHQLLVVTMTAT